jgi:hypothetical protein
MSTTLEQYREAKSSYLKLKNQAKKELIARFNELAGELMQIQRELLEDFGEKVAIPSKAKKVKSTKPAPTAAPSTPVTPPPPSPKLAALNRQLETQKKKLADARGANKPTKVIEDRIYEIEDAMRLLKEG